MRGMGLAIGLVALGSVALAAGAASANNFLENRGWQFRSADDRIARASVLDLMERKKGGYYDQWNVNNHITNNFNTTTNIAGDQINCELGASAIGNVGTNSVQARTGSPEVLNSVGIGAETIGNINENAVAAVDPSVKGARGRVRGSRGGTASGAQGAQAVNTDQSNVDSNLSSGVSNSPANVSSGAVSSTGASSQQALNSDQRNINSPQNASVSNSEACRILQAGKADGDGKGGHGGYGYGGGKSGGGWSTGGWKGGN